MSQTNNISIYLRSESLFQEFSLPAQRAKDCRGDAVHQHGSGQGACAGRNPWWFWRKKRRGITGVCGDFPHPWMFGSSWSSRSSALKKKSLLQSPDSTVKFSYQNIQVTIGIGRLQVDGRRGDGKTHQWHP